MYKFLVKLIPKRIKNSILQNYREKIEKDFELNLQKVRAQQFDLPHLDIKQKHINNLKVIENRNKLLEFLPANAVVAEVGVDIGDYSFQILKKSNPKKLHLIDCWATERYNSSKKESVLRRFDKEIKNNLVEVNLGFSTEVLQTFDNNYFDWIYLDTDHTYNTTKNELQIASKKVKRNGFICGHDYYMGNWVAGYKYGVIEAVHEFCIENDWEILYLTIEQSIPPSYVIRKI